MYLPWKTSVLVDWGDFNNTYDSSIAHTQNCVQRVPMSGEYIVYRAQMKKKVVKQQQQFIRGEFIFVFFYQSVQ